MRPRASSTRTVSVDGAKSGICDMAAGPASVYPRDQAPSIPPGCLGPARITGVETKAGGVQQLLKRLDAAWRAFTQSYAGLPEPDLLQPCVTGAWSVRDIIGHVTIWEREALKHLPLILRGGRPPRYSVTYGGID